MRLALAAQVEVYGIHDSNIDLPPIITKAVAKQNDQLMIQVTVRASRSTGQGGRKSTIGA